MTPLVALQLLAACETAAPSDTGCDEDQPLRATWIGPEGRRGGYGQFLGSPGTGEVFYSGGDPPGFRCDSGCEIEDSGGVAWEGDPGTSGEVYVEQWSSVHFPASQPVPLPEGACPRDPCVLFGLGKPIDVLRVSDSRVIGALHAVDPEAGYLQAAGIVEFSDWNGLVVYWDPITGEGPLAEGVHILDIATIGDDMAVESADASLLFDEVGSHDMAVTHDYSGDGISDVSVSFYRPSDGRHVFAVAEGPWRGIRQAANADAWVLDAWGSLVAGAAAPDFDGDGYDDIMLRNSDYEQARVGLWLGPLSSAVEFDAADVTIRDSGGRASDMSPSSPGDVDGDGSTDLLLASNYDSPNAVSHAGAVYVLLGPFQSAHDLSEAALVLNGTYEDGYFGTSTAGLGDVDGDGADEFAIGAPGAYDGDGAVYIYSYLSP